MRVKPDRPRPARPGRRRDALTPRPTPELKPKSEPELKPGLAQSTARSAPPATPGQADLAITRTDLSLATRDRILRAAAALFATHGYHAVGVAQLCESLGVSRGALYHHIQGKEELLELICSRYMQVLCELGARATADVADPVRRLERLGSDLLTVIREHHPELSVCFRETQSLPPEPRRRVLALHARYEDHWKRAWSDGARDGTLLPCSRVRLKGLLGMYYYSYLWLGSATPAALQEARLAFHDIVMAATLTTRSRRAR